MLLKIALVSYACMCLVLGLFLSNFKTLSLMQLGWLKYKTYLMLLDDWEGRRHTEKWIAGEIEALNGEEKYCWCNKEVEGTHARGMGESAHLRLDSVKF